MLPTDFVQVLTYACMAAQPLHVLDLKLLRGWVCLQLWQYLNDKKG